MPASSAGVWSNWVVFQSRFSQKRRYMRSSISAKSWASLPPVPAWKEMMAEDLS